MNRILCALAGLTVVVVAGCESPRNRPARLATPPVIAPADADPEAQALRVKLQALKAAPAVPRDDFHAPGARRIVGPVTVQDGVACFPEDRSAALYIYYATVLPRRGRLSLDFRLDQMPKDYNFMTLCAAGTGGNTKFTIRLGMDRRVTVVVVTGRQSVRLLSEPVALGTWHQLRWWYAPEGAVLEVDGAIHDYATDDSVPYAVGVGEAFYLGDQPWWDADGRRVAFYPLDSFVGWIRNLALDALQP